MLHQVQATPLIGLAGFKYHAQLATILSLLSPHDATEDAKREWESHSSYTKTLPVGGGKLVVNMSSVRTSPDDSEMVLNEWPGGAQRIAWGGIITTSPR